MARCSLIPNEISGFILEELLELEALNKAVAEASLLGGQQLVGLKRQEAVLGDPWSLLAVEEL